MKINSRKDFLRFGLYLSVLTMAAFSIGLIISAYLEADSEVTFKDWIWFVLFQGSIPWLVFFIAVLTIFLWRFFYWNFPNFKISRALDNSKKGIAEEKQKENQE
ncbi:MAG: hypothetical protein V1809_01240 [Planctomycetota bacterium]